MQFILEQQLHNLSPTRSKNIWLLFPVFGSVLFIILYIIAAFRYPGGSAIDKTAAGFSLINNYWCNLLDERSINGEFNTGRLFAVAAMIVLCVALSIFWIVFPRQVALMKYHRLIIQVTGVGAMAGSFLLYTDLDHDLVINSSSFLGFIATIGTIVALFKIRLNPLFIYGIFNVFLIALNNYLYYAKGMIVYLPVVQKISFLAFLLWFCLVSIKLYRKTFVLV